MSAIAIVCALIFITSIIALLFKRWRGPAKVLALLSVLGFLGAAFAAGQQDNNEAKQLGFLDATDMRSARSAGVNDASQWAKQRGQAEEIARKVVAERRAADQAKIAMDAAIRAERLKVPPVQVEFIAVIERARQQYNAGENQLQKGAARPARSKAICGVIKSGRMDEWIGTVEKLTTNSDGYGVLSVKIADDVTLSTSNNSFSDHATNTLINPDHDLYKTLLAMKIGGYVRVSGKFFSASSDCLREHSLTMDGSMKQPDFLVRFSKVESVDVSAGK